MQTSSSKSTRIFSKWISALMAVIALATASAQSGLSIGFGMGFCFL